MLESTTKTGLSLGNADMSGGALEYRYAQLLDGQDEAHIKKKTP